MDGASLIRWAANSIGGIADADLFDLYKCLDAAAISFVREVKILTDTAEILTVEGQQGYVLPANYLGLFARDMRRRFYIKITHDDKTVKIPMTSAEKIDAMQPADAAEWPARFVISDYPVPRETMRGTATAEGAMEFGECVLEDENADFTSVSKRDTVHNGTDSSIGVVLEVIDATHLRVALFDGATNAIAIGDAYAIVPAPRQQIFFNAPTSIADQTITVKYVCMPDPVFSPIGAWRLAEKQCLGICHEAAFLFIDDYDYQRTPDNQLHAMFLSEVSKTKREIAAEILQAGRYTRRG